jgi:hypothetical protein
MSVLAERIGLMVRLGEYLSSNNEDLELAKENAFRQNGWFTLDYINHALHAITQEMLQADKLNNWMAHYPNIATMTTKKRLGIVMAGNIPLVGFHDFLCGYLSGHQLSIKLSSKDTVLWRHLFKWLYAQSPEFAQDVQEAEMLKGCDAYIATGSNNSARYFQQYFARFPHIIRRNRTSVAVLDGNESPETLQKIADDIAIYYGLGCRNVTKIWVPEGYNFELFLGSFEKYLHHQHHNKYKNNYDYQLALYLLNKAAYMSNPVLLLVPHESVFAPISVVHYEYYKDKDLLIEQLIANDDVQCIEANTTIKNQKIVPTGGSQLPSLFDYADGVDTMAFLATL